MAVETLESCTFVDGESACTNSDFSYMNRIHSRVLHLHNTKTECHTESNHLLQNDVQLVQDSTRICCEINMCKCGESYLESAISERDHQHRDLTANECKEVNRY